MGKPVSTEIRETWGDLQAQIIDLARKGSCGQPLDTGNPARLAFGAT